jgi:hypothetical protein
VRSPSGEVVWRFEDPAHHHDALWLDNGHLLYAACEPVSAESPPACLAAAHGAGEVMVRRDRRGRPQRPPGLGMEGLRAPGPAVPHPPRLPLLLAADQRLRVMADGTVLMSLRVTAGIGVDRASGAVTLHIPPWCRISTRRCRCTTGTS